MKVVKIGLRCWKMEPKINQKTTDHPKNEPQETPREPTSILFATQNETWCSKWKKKGKKMICNWHSEPRKDQNQIQEDQRGTNDPAWSRGCAFHTRIYTIIWARQYHPKVCEKSKIKHKLYQKSKHKPRGSKRDPAGRPGRAKSSQRCSTGLVQRLCF